MIYGKPESLSERHFYSDKGQGVLARIAQHISAAVWRANEAPGFGRFSRNQPLVWVDCAAVSPIPTLRSGL